MKAFSFGTLILIAVSPLELAVAADLAPPPRQGPPPPVWSWTGPYIGGQIGAAGGEVQINGLVGSPIQGDRVSIPSFLIGGQIGYNVQLDPRWVLGVEAEAAAAVADGRNTCGAVSGTFVSFNCLSHPRAIATITGRVGYAVGPGGRTLLYGKGGAAWISNDLEVVTNNLATVDTTTSSLSKWGWTVGGGVEHAVTPAWSLKFEYSYLDFAAAGFTTPTTATIPANTADFNPTGPFNAGASQHVHLFRLGLNYRLGVDPRVGWAAASALPALPTKAPVAPPPSPVSWTAGWEIEGGVRYFWSTGTYQPEVGTTSDSSLQSRLIYDRMRTHAGELFARVDSPWNVFVKGNIGLGSIYDGKQNDEDWALDNSPRGDPRSNFVAYTNTLTSVKGDIRYASGDIGVNVLRSAGYKVGVFGGYMYFGENLDGYGCVQIASQTFPCNTPAGLPVPASLLIIQDYHTWKAFRVGAVGETMLTDRIKITGEVAYLTGVKYSGRDNHLLRPETTFFDAWANDGQGFQLESLVSYYITDRFSVGLGARYLALWTKNALSTQTVNGVVTAPSPHRFSMERAGAFVQGAYKLD